MNGWIKIHRKIRQWQHYKRPNIRMVFEDLLFSAEVTNTDYNGINLVAGDAVSSLSILQSNTGLSKPAIIKAIKELKQSGEITHRKVGNISIYHINAYCFYQSQGSKQDLPPKQKGSKQDLPPKQKGSKQDLPQVVNEVDYSGKRGLPQYENKEDNNNSLPHDARAREEGLAEQMINEQPWFEQICMSRNISQQVMAKYIIDFCNYLRDIGKEETLYEAKIHFINQLPKQIKILQDNGQRQTNGSNGPSVDGNDKVRLEALSAMASLASTSKYTDEPPY